MTDENNSKTKENYISEELSAIWRTLSHNQRRFVIAMQECATKKEGAAAIELEPQTVYRWPDAVDKAIELMALDVKNAALTILEGAIEKAAWVKVTGLDSSDEKLRQAVAAELLDRYLGKPTQRQEITGAEGGALIVEFVNDWRNVGDETED